jgi:type I restriction enzyme S subunit
LLRTKSLVPEWLSFSLYGRRAQDQLASSQYGGTKQQLGLEDLAVTSLFVPSLERQRELVQRMRAAMSQRLHLADLLERQIGTLRERREALITAAVTGEMDIPAQRAG